MITEVFNLIYMIKDIKREKLILDREDYLIMKTYYKLYNVKKVCKYKDFEKIIIDFSIGMCNSILEACNIFCEELKNKKLV